MIKMKYSAVLFVCFLIWQSCVSQTVKPCKDTMEVDIENSSLFEKESIIQDSTPSKIKIIFEQNFNDSICILCDHDVIKANRFKTTRGLGVCTDVVKIDYSKYKEIPRISIIIVGDSSDCISFYPRKGKQIAYINHVSNAWSIELSNVIREYR